MKNWKQSVFFGMVAIIAFVFVIVACGGDNGTTEKQTPVVEDFNISGIGTFDYDGTAKTVTISPKPNKSTGEITIYYNGSVTAPVAVNSYSTYSVTFDVAKTEGFNAINGLVAGTIVINPVPVKKTKVVDNFATGATMTVEYMAIPSEDITDRDWWESLSAAFALIKGSFGEGVYVLTVVPKSEDGFAATQGAKTATVGEEFLSANATVEYAILLDMNRVIGPWTDPLAKLNADDGTYLTNGTQKCLTSFYKEIVRNA